MGSSGPEAIMAGIAGCTLQVFGYGFAASFLKIHSGARFILCAMPLALSMFSSYSTIFGYLTHEQQSSLRDTKKGELVYGILEQSSVDKHIASTAASQGVSENYRTQAKGFLEANERALSRDVQLLDRLDNQDSKGKATPLDGLVKITRDKEQTTILFCAWLAVLFDLLPVVAISVLSSNRAVNRLTRPDIKSRREQPVERPNEAVSAFQGESLVEPEVCESLKVDKPQALASKPKKEIPEKKPVSKRTKNNSKSLGSQPKKKVESGKDKPQEDYDSLVLNLRQSSFEASYSSFMAHTGKSKWQAQKFFERCLNDGHVMKEGRVIKVVSPLSKVTMIDDKRGAITA